MNYYLLILPIIWEFVITTTDIDGLSSLKYGMSANITEGFHQKLRI